VIPDSSAILDWLEETRPEPALLPKSAKECAMATLWEEVALNRAGASWPRDDHRASAPHQ